MLTREAVEAKRKTLTETLKKNELYLAKMHEEHDQMAGAIRALDELLKDDEKSEEGEAAKGN